MAAPARREPAGVRPATATSACPAPPRAPARALTRPQGAPQRRRRGLGYRNWTRGRAARGAELGGRMRGSRGPAPPLPSRPMGARGGGAARGRGRAARRFPTLLNSSVPTCSPPKSRGVRRPRQELCFCRFQKRLTSPCPAGVTTMSRLAAFSNTSTPSSRAWASSSSKSTCDRNWLYRTPGGEEASPEPLAPGRPPCQCSALSLFLGSPNRIQGGNIVQ